jgi:DsbC/DsbD-like thiol-disulfide interchange protein
MRRLLGALFSTGAFVCLAGQAKYLSLSPMNVVKIHPGETVTVAVKFKVDPGMHVQANPATKKNLIPTTVSFEPVDGLEIGAPGYPEGKPFRLKGSDSDIATYDGDVEIRLPITATAKAKSGKLRLKGKLRYQACEETSCFFPMTVALEAPLVILGQKE